MWIRFKRNKMLNSNMIACLTVVEAEGGRFVVRAWESGQNADGYKLFEGTAQECEEVSNVIWMSLVDEITTLDLG